VAQLDVVDVEVFLSATESIFIIACCFHVLICSCVREIVSYKCETRVRICKYCSTNDVCAMFVLY
jgi:hypothetical protein